MMTRNLYRFPRWGYRSPFDSFEDLKRQMDLLSDLVTGSRSARDTLTSGVFPLINLTEDVNHYYARAELPGINSDDLDIQMDGKNLSISGERKIELKENVNYRRRERESGKFSRVITLPGEVSPDKVSADLKNGVLTITIPKAESAKPKKITIK